MRQTVNLYTAELRPRKQHLNARSALVLVAVVVVALVGAMAFGQWQNQQLQQRAERIERQNSQLQQAIDRMAKEVEARKPDPELEKALARITDTISRRQRLLERVDSLASNNDSGFASRMAALARQVPSQLWLTAIRLESSPPRLGLEGRTRVPERVPLYLEQLGSEAVFAGQTFRDFLLTRPDDEDASGEWVAFRVATHPSKEAGND
ncbi:PilN domain-containing protein [Marinobacter persicus]|uniref:MSHA biogenesis protein MshI n=1 Tax=Marinobacter persicus TaxID=930118 RepID=A0A2S6G480_9GAMM|nr:PilN domain-containing protein [Marinobacter persicus]PPK51823.1 MSHA biogenesis protein MshI [Marinobacter persicus]PPK53923.1 MSHA biogenesis protein MshI [Marinobacter persicus]PPK58754.1 MSHA biogenesis protein MshI [Marinobacter persicus]